MSGTANFYRIRVGEYRIGIVVEGDRVDFVRCLPRRDLYRFSHEFQQGRLTGREGVRS